jgi:hypothetical protein
VLEPVVYVFSKKTNDILVRKKAGTYHAPKWKRKEVVYMAVTDLFAETE